jgi:hypothetical protein
MATKRTPLRRDHHPPISAEALATWRRLGELKRQGATRGDEYRMLGKRLCGLIGLDWCSMMWPTDAKSAKVPASLLNRPLQAEAYRAAWAARCALLEAEAAAEAAAD